MKWVQFIDSGGHQQYHDILPLFVQNSGASIFVFKLSEKLSEHPIIEYYVDGKRLGKPYQSPLSHVEILKQCISAMCSQDAQLEEERVEREEEEVEEDRVRRPLIMVVGTHSDEAGKCTDETIEDKDRQLLGLLKDNPPLLYKGEQMTKVIFAVNGQAPEDNDRAAALEIRNKIVSMFPKCMKMPIAWFILEVSLRKSSDDGILSLKQCQECARELHMQGDVFSAALRHLVQHNVFLHYPEVPQVVFCDPQVVLNKVRELVQYNHKLRHDPDESVGVDSDAKKFKYHGILSVELLKKFPTHYKGDLFTEKDLLKILVNVHAIAMTSKCEYFMPALLPYLNDTEVSKYLQEDPLMIRFANDGEQRCIPSGLFCYLIAYFLNQSTWKVSMHRSIPSCMHRNCITFTHTKTADIVTLIDIFFSIGVHVKDPSIKACREIRECIHSGINHAFSKLKYHSLKFEDAFLCPGAKCLSDSRHLARVVTSDSIKKWNCTIIDSQKEGLSVGQLMWLGESAVSKEYTST